MLRRFTIESISLSRIDTLKVEAIVLPMFQEMAQPQGVAGYFDWRLCGRLGQLISSAEFGGARDELMLLSYAARVGPKQLFLYGLGAPKLRPADQCYEELGRILKFVIDGGATSVALAVPQPHGVETLCNWLQAPGIQNTGIQNLIILDADGALEDGRDKIHAILKKTGLLELMGSSVPGARKDKVKAPSQKTPKKASRKTRAAKRKS